MSPFIQSDWDGDAMLQGAVIGAVSGGAGFGAGALAGNITASQIVAGAAGGMTAGGVSAGLTGGNIGQGMLIGTVAGGIGGYIGTYDFGSAWGEGFAQIGSGALVGGAASELTGGTFAEGLKLGAISGVAAFATSRFIQNLEYKRAAELQEAKASNANALDVQPGERTIEQTSRPKEVWDSLKKINQKFGPEIESIRSRGSCTTCEGRLRFRGLHVRKYSNGSVKFHYDTYDVVTDPFKHIFYDYVWQDKILGRTR